MSWQVGIWVAGALLLCWTVGAYNRLVSLRNAIVKGFEPVDLQFGSRHALLQQQLDAVGGVLSNAAERLETLRAACQQAALWPGSFISSGGSSRRQRSDASRQRGAKRQPVMSRSSAGTMPGISARRLCRCVPVRSTFGTDPSSPTV